MTRVLLFVLAACFALVAEAHEKSYHGYEQLEAFIHSKKDQQVLNHLSELDPELDFWYRGPDSNHVFVPPEKLTEVKEFFTRNGIDYRVMNDHIQQDIEQEMRRLSMAKAFDIDDFNTFDDIAAELVNIAGRCRTDLGVTCEVYSFGKSSEGRDLWTLKISRSGSGRKGVWLDATTHAREWLGTATNLKILTNLVDNYPTDPDVQQLVDTYDWYFSPVVNPDGYVYTWASDRMWRKSRNANSGSPCFGTDLNRNFDQAWGNAGSSTLPCVDTYRGSSAGSEPETQAVQYEALRLGPSLLTSIHFHTYGQYWLIPWGSYADDGVTCNYAEDHQELQTVADTVADAIENTYGTNWLRGNSCGVIYPASGITMDYFKGVAGVKHTATPELRGSSFIVAKAQIQLSFNEVWNGLLALINALS